MITKKTILISLLFVLIFYSLPNPAGAAVVPVFDSKVFNRLGQINTSLGDYRGEFGAAFKPDFKEEKHFDQPDPYPSDSLSDSAGWFFEAWNKTFGPYGWFTQKEVGYGGYEELTTTSLAASYDAQGFYDAKDVLDNISIEVSNLIKSGRFGKDPANSAGPLFVTNYEDHLYDSTYNARNIFVGEYTERAQTNQAICAPFSAQLQYSLVAENTRTKTNDEQAFAQQSVCTIDEPGSSTNLENFYDDFEQGGWDTWLTMLEPQNNPFGSYLITQEELAKRENAAIEETLNKFQSSQGILDNNICVATVKINPSDGSVIKAGTSANPTPCEFTEANCYCTRFETKTPGTFVRTEYEPIQKAGPEVKGSADENLEQRNQTIGGAPTIPYRNSYETIHKDISEGLYQP